MTRPFTKGPLKVILCYAIGFSLSWLLKEVIGVFGDGPGLDLLEGLLILIGGTIWIIVGLTKLFLNTGDKTNLGSLMMNIIAMSVIIGYIMISRNRTSPFYT